MTLVDTSVWAEAFRFKSTLRIEKIVSLEEIVLCLPVYQEVLQGFQSEEIFRQTQETLSSLPMVESPLTQAVVDDAVNLYRNARRQGITIRSSVDCLIAACAIRHNLTVLHRDRDFLHLAKLSSLKQRSC